MTLDQVNANLEAQTKMYNAVADFFIKASTVLIMVAEAVAREAAKGSK